MESKKKPRALAIEDRAEPKKVEKIEKKIEREGKRAKPAYGFVPGVRRSTQKREKPRQSQPDEEPEPEVLKPAIKKRGVRGRVRIVKVA